MSDSRDIGNSVSGDDSRDHSAMNPDASAASEPPSDVSISTHHRHLHKDDKNLWRDLSRFMLLFSPLLVLGFLMLVESNVRGYRDRLGSQMRVHVLLRSGVDEETVEQMAVELAMMEEWDRARVISPGDQFRGLPEVRDWMGREGRSSINQILPFSIEANPADALVDPEAVLASCSAIGEEALVEEVFVEGDGLRSLSRKFGRGLAGLRVLEIVMGILALGGAFLGRKLSMGSDDPFWRRLAPCLSGGAVWLLAALVFVFFRYVSGLGDFTFFSWAGSLFLIGLGFVLGCVAVFFHEEIPAPPVGASLFGLFLLLALGRLYGASGEASLRNPVEVDRDHHAKAIMQSRIEQKEREMIFLVDWIHSRDSSLEEVAQKKRMNEVRMDLEQRKSLRLAQLVEEHKQGMADFCLAVTRSRVLLEPEATVLSTRQRMQKVLLSRLVEETLRANRRNWEQLRTSQLDLVQLRKEATRYELYEKYAQLSTEELKREKQTLMAELKELYAAAGKSIDDSDSLALLFFRELSDLSGTPRASDAEELDLPSPDSGARNRGKWIVRIPVSPGEKIRAVKAGRVLHAGEFLGMGQIAVLAHGDGLSSIYSLLGFVGVKQGQAVARGDVIGTAPVIEAEEAVQVHFELRREGTLVPVEELDGMTLEELQGRIVSPVTSP